MSSGGDLGAEVGIDVGDSEPQLAKVEKGLKGIGAAARQARRESIDYQRDASKFFQGMRTHAQGAEQSMHSLRHAVRFAGEQLDASGITGSRGISGALSLSGTFGKIVGGVAVLGVALKAQNTILQAQEDRYEMARKAAEAYFETVKAGHAEESKSAKAGLGQTGDIRQLVALGGGAAIKEADALAADPRNGISGAQARRGVARSYLLRPDIREEATRSALAANSTGLMGFEQAIDEIVKSPQLQGVLRAGVTAQNKGGLDGSIALGNSRNVVLGRLLSDATGSRISAPDAGQIYRNTLNPGAGGAFLDQSNQAQAITNRIDVAQRGGVESGLATGDARKELAAVLNPVAQGLVQLSIAQTRLAAALERKAGEESLIEGVTGAFGAKGNARNQSNRNLDATSSAGGG